MSHEDPRRASAEVTTTYHTTGYEDVARRGRRPLGGWWWGALLGVPLLLGLVGAGVNRGGIESDLTQRASAALSAAGFTGVNVAFDGRDGTVTVPPGVDAATALSVVEAVDGVRVATASGGGGTASPTATVTGTPTSTSTPTESATSPAPQPAGFSIARTAQGILLEGVVPDEATHQGVLSAATSAAAGAAVTDHLVVEAVPGGLTPAIASSLIAALPAGQDVSAAYDGTTLTLTGQVVSEAAKASLAVAAAKALPSATITNQLIVAAPSGTAACGTLKTDLVAILTARPLRYAESVSALSSAQSSTVTAVAAKLKGCVGVDGGVAGVSVVGHSDRRGAAEPTDAISVARASVVRAALIAAGVPAEKITATGVGSSQPVASDSTEAGRAQNRRVEILVK